MPTATRSPSSCEVPLRLAGWLALPLLRLADSVKKTPFYTTMVGPERLGVALDAAMVRAGLSSEAKATPLAPSVLRLQLDRALPDCDSAAEPRRNPRPAPGTVIPGRFGPRR